ncbi:MAG: hypothetical protein ACJAS1_007163 [Oleiphilaceae bacterium]|jgi:hypothetical protein
MSKLTKEDVQAIWDKCLYVGWVEFLSIGRCHIIFKGVLEERHNVTGNSLVEIGNKYNLKRFFIKDKHSSDLFMPFAKQQARAVLCGRIKFFKCLMSVSMEELTLDGFLYYLSKNKWCRYINAYDAELTKERNKNKASGADRYISLRKLSSSGFESAK